MNGDQSGGADLAARARADLGAALKAGDRERVDALRMLLADLRNKEIEKGRPLEPDEALAIVAAGVKSRNESVEQFRAAGREDLVARESAQAEVLRAYLPAQLAPAELDALVEEAVAATGAASPRDIGRVMGWLMPRVRGRADGAEVSRRVKERLAG
jgi:uncharacterized protein YqeY